MDDLQPQSEPSEPEGVYGLAGADVAPPLPPLPGTVVFSETFDQLIDRVAADMVIHAETCVRQFGDFHMALSGGDAPMPLYERLMYDPNFRRLPWRRTHLWFVEERAVPFNDAHSACRGIRETIGDHSDIPREQFHPIFAQAPNADKDYEKQIREALAWREKGHDRLDYILLTVGDDGGVAGLFPFDEVLREQRRFMRRTLARDVSPAERITMTLPLINSARFIAVLAGGGAGRVLQRVARGRESADEMPIKGVRPISGELAWYLDADACRAG